GSTVPVALMVASRWPRSTGWVRYAVFGRPPDLKYQKPSPPPARASSTSAVRIHFMGVPRGTAACFGRPLSCVSIALAPPAPRSRGPGAPPPWAAPPRPPAPGQPPLPRLAQPAQPPPDRAFVPLEDPFAQPAPPAGQPPLLAPQVGKRAVAEQHPAPLQP